MVFTLLSHQWKSFWRSRNAGQSLVAQLFIGALVVYFLTVALVLGISLRHFLVKSLPGQDPVIVFCGFILYYFSMDILMRFMLQELPVLSVEPYLAQNIRKNTLVFFLNIRSLFHFLNLLPSFIFIPFTVTAISAAHGHLAATCFLVAILFTVIFNNFFLLYIKRKTIVNSWWFVIFLGTVGIVAALDYFGIFSLRTVSVWLSGHLLARPWLVIVPIALGLLAFINNRNFLRKNLYLEEISKKGRQKQSKQYTWLEQLGLSGELIALDIKLILRNKRPKSVLMITILILFYGFLFYTPENLHKQNLIILLFGAIFITGIFIINYGQFLFAWHSSYFDGLMSANIDMRVYIRSRFLLFTSVSTISFILTSLYGLISWKILPIQLAAYLYNIGIVSVLSTYMATRNYKAIDLSKSATFNYQGTGSAQWINALVIMLVPVLIQFGLAKLISPWAGIIVLGSLGLVSLLLQNWWIGIITAGFHKRKHLILQGFREK